MKSVESHTANARPERAHSESEHIRPEKVHAKENAGHKRAWMDGPTSDLRLSVLGPGGPMPALSG